MKWTEVPTGKTHSAFQHFMVALGEEADVAVERINSEAEFAKRLATYARNGGLEPSSSQQRAREIMGKNFFGVEEAISHLGVNPTRRQLANLSEVPFSEATLQQCKDTHVLVAVFPLSILGVREKVQGQGLFYNQSWYNEEAFASERGEVSWQLVRKTPVDNSTSKNWTAQQALIGEDDEVPSAQVLVYTIIGHFLATGERLFERIYVRTSSVYSDGYRVYVGYFDDSGLNVYSDWDDVFSDGLGVSSARK